MRSAPKVNHAPAMSTLLPANTQGTIKQTVKIPPAIGGMCGSCLDLVCSFVDFDAILSFSYSSSSISTPLLFCD
jgi:hypothetical protein